MTANANQELSCLSRTADKAALNYTYSKGRTIIMAKAKSTSKTMSIVEVMEYANSTRENKWLLRAPAEAVWRKYAGDMLEGATFPPIVLGQINDDGELRQIVADGIHRSYALHHLFCLHTGLELSDADAKQAEKLTEEQHEVIEELTSSVPVQIVQFNSVGEAMADQLRRNAEQGRGLAEQDRDKRIVYMTRDPKAINPKTNKPYDPPGLGMKLAEVGELVGLSESSVSRISRGEQNITGKMRGGNRTGSKGAAYLDVKSLSKAFEGIRKTLNHTEGRIQLVKNVDNETLAVFNNVAQLITSTVQWAGEARKKQAAFDAELNAATAEEEKETKGGKATKKAA